MLSSVSSSLTHFWSGQQLAQVRTHSRASQFPSHGGLECGAGMGLNSAILGHVLSVQVSWGDFYKSAFVEADLASVYPVILHCHPLSHMDFRLDSCWDCSHVGQRQMKHNSCKTRRRMRDCTLLCKYVSSISLRSSCSLVSLSHWVQLPLPVYDCVCGHSPENGHPPEATCLKKMGSPCSHQLSKLAPLLDLAFSLQDQNKHFLTITGSTTSQRNCFENKARKGGAGVQFKSSLYLYLTFDGAGHCGNYIFSPELRKCRYYCKANTKELLLT